MEKLIEKQEKITLKWFLELYKRFPIIAVTWPAWVWKSTITKIISKYIWWIIFTELPENNPFLNIIKTTNWKVDNTIWWSNQNYFLATDSAQLSNWYIESKKQPVIFDFALTQPLIFTNKYYKNWIVEEYFNLDWTHVVEIDNSKNLAEEELEIQVINFIKNFVRKSI